MCCSGNRDLMAQAILASITNDQEARKNVEAAFIAAGLAPAEAPAAGSVVHGANVAHEHPRHARRTGRIETGPLHD